MENISSSRPARSLGSTRDYTYKTLKNKILNLELGPATKISEKDISEQLKVSRTPVREAFLKLSQEELLEIYPQSGTFVSKISLSQVEEARFVRENLEKAVVREACDVLTEEGLFQLETNLKMQEMCAEKNNVSQLFELDEQFHQVLYLSCGKRRTWNMVQQMASHFNRLRMLRLAVILNWEVIISQHKQIVEYIKTKDKDNVEKVISEHLKLVIAEKGELERNYPNYFN
ncbi:GntR family transcriptional regulator [Alteribacillus sp. HJP-4]|uniref:GntR family transcriptional regulator n=1 Tax=Alteribacillus sp. HJP-4 TaxID=2775394 RepID=UPI0035CCFC06